MGPRFVGIMVCPVVASNRGLELAMPGEVRELWVSVNDYGPQYLQPWPSVERPLGEGKIH